MTGSVIAGLAVIALGVAGFLTVVLFGEKYPDADTEAVHAGVIAGSTALILIGTAKLVMAVMA